MSQTYDNEIQDFVKNKMQRFKQMAVLLKKCKENARIFDDAPLKSRLLNFPTITVIIQLDLKFVHCQNLFKVFTKSILVSF